MWLGGRPDFQEKPREESEHPQSLWGSRNPARKEAGAPIKGLQLLGLRHSLRRETCWDFLAIDPRTPLPALIGHEGRIRLMGHLQRLEHGGQETKHLRSPRNGVIFLLADGWAIKLIYTHSLFQPWDSRTSSGRKRTKREKCSVQENWKIRTYLMRMGLTFIVGSACFILMLPCSTRQKLLSFPFCRSRNWGTQKLTIWPMVAQIKKGRLQAQIHITPKPALNHHIAPLGIQVSL